jgi:hypothetical protein
MKFKAKHALAAVALAIAGQAGAQTLSALPATGDPSFFFVAIDEAAGRSYFSELVSNAGSTTVGALNMSEIISNPNGNWTITLSGLNTFTSGTSTALADIFGGFGAAEANATVGGGTTPQTGSRRVIASVAQGADGTSVSPAFNNGQISAAATNIGNFHNSFQGVGPGLCDTSPCVATSGSALNYAGLTNPSLLGLGTQFGLPSGPSIGDSLAGTVAWDLYLAVSNSTSQVAAATVTQLALRAVLDLATNTLTITSNVVPIPAAVWLFGSALLGLFGIGRRKSGALAAA